MFARVLSLAALVFVPLAFAAPAPFVKPATPQADVEIQGFQSSMPQGGIVPSVITNETAYRGLADAWGIKSPPPVNFRTHFLVVRLYSGHGTPRFQIVGGDLRAAAVQVDVLTADRRLVAFKCKEAYSPPRFLIKSFRRSAVKTVNGQPLPTG
jgi:hypothetical protein